MGRDRKAEGALLAFVALSSATACAKEIIRLDLPEPTDAHALVWVLEHPGRVQAGAADLDSRAGLDDLPATEIDGAAPYLSVLYFREPLSTLGLAAGRDLAAHALSFVFLEAYAGAIDGGVSRWERPSTKEALRPAVIALLYESCEFQETAEGRACLPSPYCTDGRCARDFCYGEPRTIQGIEGGESNVGPTPLLEDGALWLYFVTDRWYLAGSSTSTLPRPLRHHARARLVAHDQIDPSTVEPVTTTDFSGTGWTFGPRFANLGREMVFESSRPDGHWWDGEVYLAARERIGAAWSPPHLIADYPEVGERLGTSMVSPVMLLDQRTLLLSQDNLKRLAIYRRPSARLGDAAFTVLGSIPIEAGYGVHPAGLSCDGRHLLYVRRKNDWAGTTEYPLSPPFEPRVAVITAVDGAPSLASTAPLPLPVGTDHGGPYEKRGIIHISEHPSCEGVYFSDFVRSYFAPQVPCDG
ncbi:MAG: hypothetical protein IT384_20965 [Deltaproteobacteria bacterium]|nr:hypothetical protein [Deltaproteobacteria bacterium]